MIKLNVSKTGNGTCLKVTCTGHLQERNVHRCSKHKAWLVPTTLSRVQLRRIDLTSLDSIYSQPNFMALPSRMLKTLRKYQWQTSKYRWTMQLQWTPHSNRTQLSSLICHICAKAFRLWMVWCKQLLRSVQIVKIKDLCQDTHRTLHKGSQGSTLVPSPTTLLKIQPLSVLRCG